MPDGYLISVGVKADFSELKAQQAAAQDAVKQAAQNMKEAYAQFGQAAAQGSAQAVEALKVYENELTQAEARSISATQAMAQAQTAVGAATAATVPQFVAASAAMRTMEGNFTNNARAASRFLTSVLGLGPALQAAFPVIGAIAFGGVIVQIGESLVKFGAKAEELATELGTDWMTGAIGQIDGLAAAVKQADEAIDHLNRDLDEGNKRAKQDTIENIRLTQGQAAAYNAEAADKKSQIVSLQKQLNNLERDAADLRSKAASTTGHKKSFSGGQIVDEGPSEANLKAAKDLEVVEKQIATYRRESTDLAQEATNLEIQASQVKEKKVKHPEDTVDFDIEKLMAEEAIKDQKKIEEEIKKAAKEHGEMVVEMAKDNDRLLKENERITEEITKDWEKSYNEQLRASEETAKKKEKVDADYVRKQRQDAEQLAAMYRSLTDGITADMMRGVDSWLQGSERFGRSMEQAASRMALSMVNALVKIGAQELVGLAIHQSVAHTQSLTDAKTAAKGAYAATAGIPVIGPILAPIAAGAAFAAVAAFDTGADYIPRTGLAVLHQGEAVATRGENSQISKLIAMSGGGKPGGASLHYAPTINGAGNDKEMQRVIRSSSRDVAASVKRALRNGHL